jgi:hypothetical protein
MADGASLSSTVILVTREGSTVLEPLRALEQRGCQLLVCTTCLEFYRVRDRLRVGTACAMPDILNAQLEATKVVTV